MISSKGMTSCRSACGATSRPAAASALVRVPNGARIEWDGDLLSFGDLASLFASLQPGDEMELDINGIADSAGDLLGYEMEVREP